MSVTPVMHNVIPRADNRQLTRSSELFVLHNLCSLKFPMIILVSRKGVRASGDQHTIQDTLSCIIYFCE
jgi:hypothetical protein